MCNDLNSLMGVPDPSVAIRAAKAAAAKAQQQADAKAHAAIIADATNQDRLKGRGSTVLTGTTGDPGYGSNVTNPVDLMPKRRFTTLGGPVA